PSPFSLLSLPSILIALSQTEMVSTATSSVSSSHQYITDYVPITGDKSPLAMLKKTCETIGLPETPARKCGSSSSSSPSDKKGSPSSTKKENKSSSSPKGTVTTTFPSALGFPPMGSSFPFMGFPGMPSFPPSMLPSSPMMPSMMSMMGMKPPCPAILMGRQCTQPGCPSCTPSTSFDSLNPFMNPPAYQAFLAAAAAAAAAQTPSTSGSLPSTSSSSLSLPSTSSSSLSLPSTSSAPSTSSSFSSSPPKHSCGWSGCDKSFSSTDDLTLHLKDHVVPSSSTPSTPTPSSSSDKSSPKMTSSSSSSVRYNPYSKPVSLPVSMPSIPSMPPMQMMMGMNPLLMSGLFPQMRLPI
ncbi:hypothetical protein PFISCL1PPCAC_15769, partial [Pristionchus fissidentatus]